MLTKDNKNIIVYIKDNIKISDIVKEKVKLQQNGQVFKGLCPFHREKTPSFLVNDQRKTFHCFGCGAHGDIFTFLQKTTTLTFKEILDDFSKKLGITTQNNNSTQKNINNYQEKLNILELAAQFFEENLKKNQNAQHYLQQRMINKETIQKFRLGYIGNNNELYKHLVNKQCKINLMLELGLIVQKNNRIYDYFFNRLIFPIININNKVVGFGGRNIDDSAKTAKYINSKESNIFQKSNLLYGENLLKSEQNTIFVTEGYFDVLSMQQNNFSAVAVMGTTLNEINLKKLQKYKEIIYLFFDNDNAGHNATNKTVFETIVPNLIPASLIYVTQPDKNFKDPHELLNQPNAIKTIKHIISKSQLISDFILKKTLYSQNINNPETYARIEFLINKIILTIKNPQIKKNFQQYCNIKMKQQFFFKTKKKSRLTNQLNNKYPITFNKQNK